MNCEKLAYMYDEIAFDNMEGGGACATVGYMIIMLAGVPL